MCAVRIGAVPYLNACVLVEGLETYSGVELSRVRPSGLAEMLDRGELDVALTPSVDFLRRRDRWEVAAWYGITCCGAAWTVRIVSDVPMERLTRLYVDADSHSSVALAGIILRGWLGREVKFVRREFDGEVGGQHVGWLVIGDKAMNVPERRYAYDLGELWYERTSLPFVFALWVSRRGESLDGVAGMLEEVARRNACRVEDLADRLGPLHGFAPAEAREYLGDVIRYPIGQAERQGLELFGRLLAEHGAERISV